MRRPFRSAVVLSVLAPALAVAPAVLPDVSPDPRPVAPHVQEIALPGAAPTLTKQAQRGATAPTVETGQLDTRPFSVVGVTWAPTAGVGDVTVALRTRADGAWSGWTTVEETVEAQADAPVADRGARGGTEPVWTDASDGVQVRISVTDGAVPRDVQVALVDPGDSPADATVSQSRAASADAAAVRPRIHSRAEWGADERIRRGNPSYSSTVRAMTLHHTASGNDYRQSDVPALIRGFYAYHVQSRGWSDLGYNYLVDKFGGIWEGRHGGIDRPVLGSHAGGFNTDTSGVSMIGNYEAAGTTEPMLDAVARVMAWKLSLHDRDPRGQVTLTSRGSTRYKAGQRVRLPVIFGHIDVSTTSCPGGNAIRELPALRERAAQHVQGGGAAVTSTSPPVGHLDEVTRTGGTDALAEVLVRGWALDRDTTDPVTVQVSLDGVPAASAKADRSRPDVGAAFGHGDARGFAVTLPAVPPGRHAVCVDAVDPDTGQTVRLGCGEISTGPPSTPLRGALDGVAVVPGGLQQVGWAYDPEDPAAPATVDVLVDGVTAGTATTGGSRTDVSRANAGAPETTGWSARTAGSPGRHEVCAVAHRAQRTDAGSPVGCRDVWVLEGVAPLGHLDAIAVDPGRGVTVAGWAIDPRTYESTSVQVLVDGRLAGTVPADRARSDVGAVYPGYGDFHGFHRTVPIGPGAHDVCVRAVDRATGAVSHDLGCARRTASGAPVGALDLLQRSGDTVRVMGWAVDPDVAASTARIVVDGAVVRDLTADDERPDLLPLGFGSRHGFDERVPVGAGPVTVCVGALDSGSGTAHRMLGCRQV